MAPRWDRTGCPDERPRSWARSTPSAAEADRERDPNTSLSLFPVLVKATRRSGAKLLFFTVGCAVCLMICLGNCCCERTNGDTSKRPPRAVELFERLRFKTGRLLEPRRKAAAALAKHPNGEGWVIRLLLEPYAFWGMDERPDLPDDSFQYLHRPVVAALLEGLPVSASKPLLWAVTYKLDDKEGGEYSRHERVGWFTWAQMSCVTEPIRDIARAALVRSLGVDHKYDKAAWRRAILKMNDKKRTTTQTAPSDAAR